MQSNKKPINKHDILNTMPCWKDLTDNTNNMKPATTNPIKITKEVTMNNKNTGALT